MDSLQRSLNFQRGDFVVGEHEHEVELDRAPGEVTRQPGAEFHGVLTHRSMEYSLFHEA